MKLMQVFKLERVINCKKLLGILSLSSSFNRRCLHNHNQEAFLSYNVYEPPTSSSDQTGSSQEYPLLVTHGLLGSKLNWNSIAKAVAKASGLKVITFDARNHGDSPHFPDHSYEIMAEDITKLVTQLKIPKFSLMGHSMGGRTAMTFALKYPHLLEKLIIVDISPINLGDAFPSNQKYVEAIYSIKFDPNSKLTLSQARKIADEKLKSVAHEASLRAFFITNLAEKDGAIVWKPNLRALLAQMDEIRKFPDHLLSTKCNVPTLFFRGEHSTYIPESDIPMILRTFPTAQVNTVKGAGHWLHADNPTDFVRSLIQFLKS